MCEPRVLVGCEFTGELREALRRHGADAWSCDRQDSERPGPHIRGNVLDVLHLGWHALIAFPDCTYLASSGLHWNTRRPGRAAKTEAALDFVRTLLHAPIPCIALENPVGCIGTRIRPPDQVIQPWMFGEDASKSTCLWLKNLPCLRATRHVEPSYGCPCGHRFKFALGKYGCPNCEGASGPARMVWANQTNSGQNRLGPSETRARDRSRTYPGIAEAMAEQWLPVITRYATGDLTDEPQPTLWADHEEVGDPPARRREA